jgi:hypothetical protein
MPILEARSQGPWISLPILCWCGFIYRCEFILHFGIGISLVKLRLLELWCISSCPTTDPFQFLEALDNASHENAPAT